MSSHQLSCLEGASAVIVAGMWFSVLSPVKLSWGNGMIFMLFSTTNEGCEGAFVCTWQVRYNLCVHGFLLLQIALAAWWELIYICSFPAAGMWFSVFSPVKLSWGCICATCSCMAKDHWCLTLWCKWYELQCVLNNQCREGAFACTWQVRYNLCLNGFLSLQIAFAAMCSHQLSCLEGAPAVIARWMHIPECVAPWMCIVILDRCIVRTMAVRFRPHAHSLSCAMELVAGCKARMNAWSRDRCPCVSFT